MRHILIAIAVVLLSFSLVHAGNDLVNVKSSHDVKTTVELLLKALNAKGMKVFAVIDHAEGAKKAGNELRPTTLVIFGNPKIGSKLMQCNQTVGIELPMKALIWKDGRGQVWLTYIDPEEIADRHNIKDCGKAVVKKIKKALKNFAAAATKP